MSAEDRLVDPDDLAACVTLDGPVAPDRGVTYVVGLDVGLRHDATVAAVMHKERDGGRLVLDRMEVWSRLKGQTVELGVVEQWLDLTCRAYNSAKVVYDPYQAVQLAQRLRSRGIPTSEYQFTASSVGRLAPACANIRSVTAQGHPRVKFARAIKARNVFLAEVALGELEQVLLEDALQIVRLYGDEGDAKIPLRAGATAHACSSRSHGQSRTSRQRPARS